MLFRSQEAAAQFGLKDSSEKETLLFLLKKYAGHKGHIAEYLGIDRSTLWRKLKKYQMQD